eukprot:TRINITY_DN5177_c0_g1_i1.p1 TRINITY_DN5177_c0_g1~~TRINITY_DN5177_c0_g1_i1.p1  ORF type:complete len:57 (+),score=3.93 TRINITY_DN5177_c0_g1_i1:641-811(+)
MYNYFVQSMDMDLDFSLSTRSKAFTVTFCPSGRGTRLKNVDHPEYGQRLEKECLRV